MITVNSIDSTTFEVVVEGEYKHVAIGQRMQDFDPNTLDALKPTLIELIGIVK